MLFPLTLSPTKKSGNGESLIRRAEGSHFGDRVERTTAIGAACWIGESGP
jgi:hypothetical protein